MNGMQDEINTQVNASIENWWERESAFSELKELTQKDPTGLATAIKILISRETERSGRFLRERYDFDVRRWIVEDSGDWSLLPQSRSPREANAIVDHVVTYTFWECIRMATEAILTMASEEGRVFDEDRLIHFLVVHLGLCNDDISNPLSDPHLLDPKLPPLLRERMMVEAAGWVGSRISLDLNKPLRRALSGGGDSPFQNLIRELPSAVLTECHEHADYERDRDPSWIRKIRILGGLDGEPMNRRGSPVARITRMLKGLGSESASRPEKLTSLPPDDVSSGNSEDEYIAEFERQQTLRQDLQRLESWVEQAKFSKREAQVYELDMRMDFDTQAAAHELGVEVTTIRGLRKRYQDKLRKAAKIQVFSKEYS